MSIALVLKFIQKLMKYLLEYRSDSNNLELLETAKNMNEDVEGDSQLNLKMKSVKEKRNAN